MKKLFRFWRGGAADAHPANRPRSRSIFVDVSVLAASDAGTGIQRVVRAVYTQMVAAVPQGWRIVPVAATRTKAYTELRQDFLAQRQRAGAPVGPRIEPQPGDIFFGLDFAAHILPGKRAILRRWRRSGVFCAFVVYDLIPHTNPEWFRKAAVRHFRRWLNTVLNNADLVISISEHVRQGYLGYANATGHRARVSGNAVVVRLGWDIDSSAPSKGVGDDLKRLLERIGHGGSYVLMIGTVEPRKAYDIALKSFEVLWSGINPECSLIIVGCPGWKTGDLQEGLSRHPESGNRLWWLHDVTDEGLAILYSKVSGVLFTSYAEGYGLPVGEALKHGKRVLARDIPVLRELFADGVDFFDDDSPQELAKRIKGWLRSIPLVAEHGASVLPTWEQSAEDVFAALGVSARNEIA